MKNFLIGCEALLLLIGVLALTPFIIIASPFLIMYYPTVMPTLIMNIRSYVKELENRVQ